MRHPPQELLVPAVDLQPALLVVRQRHPLIAPVARADGVGMPSARRCRVQADLALHVARGAQLEGRDVARQVRRVGPRRRVQVPAAVRERAHVRPVHLGVRDPRRDQRVRQLREGRDVRLLVDHVDGESVPGLHQHIQVLPAGMQRDPARVVARRWGAQTVDERQLARLLVLLVRPDAVPAQVRRVQVRLGGIEHHAVDARLRAVLVVLDVLHQRALRVDREHVPEPGVVVEGIAIHVERRLLRGQHEDGARVGVETRGSGWSLC